MAVTSKQPNLVCQCFALDQMCIMSVILKTMSFLPHLQVLVFGQLGLLKYVWGLLGIDIYKHYSFFCKTRYKIMQRNELNATINLIYKVCISSLTKDVCW